MLSNSDSFKVVKFSSFEILKEMLLYYLPEMVLLPQASQWPNVKGDTAANAGNIRGTVQSFCLRKNLLEEGTTTHFSILPREFNWQRNLVAYDHRITKSWAWPGNDLSGNVYEICNTKFWSECFLLWTVNVILWVFSI